MDKRATLYGNQALKMRATLTPEEKQKTVSKATDQGQNW